MALRSPARLRHAARLPYLRDKRGTIRRAMLRYSP